VGQGFVLVVSSSPLHFISKVLMPTFRGLRSHGSFVWDCSHSADLSES
jgi:hypothetical protein